MDSGVLEDCRTQSLRGAVPPVMLRFFGLEHLGASYQNLEGAIITPPAASLRVLTLHDNHFKADEPGSGRPSCHKPRRKIATRNTMCKYVWKMCLVQKHPVVHNSVCSQFWESLWAILAE